MLSRIASAIVFCLVVAGCLPVMAEDTPKVSRVLLLPFDGTSAGDFKYLTDSVRSMLAGRLAAMNSVEVVDYTLSPEELRVLHGGEGDGKNAEAVFTKFKLDYILTGALYSLQTGLKIQATLNGKSSGQTPREGVFSVLAQNEDSIISSVDNLVDDIAARGMGVQTDGSFLAEVKADEKAGTAGFNTEHPEKLFKKGLYGGTIIAESNMQVESLGVRRSSDLPLSIVSMATWDFDHDGVFEIVAASRASLEIYRFEETLFKKLAEYTFDNSYKIHAVNVADLDGNGEPEIYISANDKIPASSAIFTWSGSGGLQPVMTRLSYYIRPVEIPGEGLILAGQAGDKDFRTGYVAKNVVKLAVSKDGKGVMEEKVLPLPENVNLFSFTYADIDGDNIKEVIAIDLNDKLLVYSPNNSLIYVSENSYGGSRNFIGPAKSAFTSFNEMIKGGENGEKLDQPYIYVPTRLVAADIDGDGTDEIIVGANKRITPIWLRNTREYDGGAVVCLSWLDEAMGEVWRTNTVNGYLADYSTLLPSSPGDKAISGAADVLYLAQVPDAQILGLSWSKDSKLLKYDLTISTKE